MTHTRGPWTLLRSYNGMLRVVSGLVGIARVNANLDQQANARLIAAAPDQHIALRQVSEGVNTIIDNWAHWTDDQIRAHLWQLQSIAQAAYDKAEGREPESSGSNHPSPVGGKAKEGEGGSQ